MFLNRIYIRACPECLATKLLYISLFYCLIFSADLLASQENDTGYLNIRTRYLGLTVKVDGKVAGYTPMTKFPLPAGKHFLFISHPEHDNWLGEDWHEQILVTAGDTLHINAVFKMSYSINSKPYGANVYLSESFTGITPAFVNLMDNETATVRLAKTGFRDTTFVIGRTTVRNFDIKMDNIKNIDMQESAFMLTEKKSSRKPMLTAMGLSVISGALALYFRSKADDNYDRYRETGNPQDFNKYYDEAKKYDKYAAVSFGVFQVSFVFSFYFFLSHANK